MKQQFTTRAEMLGNAKDRARDDPLALPIRELVSYWQARSRGHRVVAEVRAELGANGLVSEPDFAAGYIDNTVRLVTAPVGPSPAPDDSASEGFLRVDSLRCATQGVEWVSPDAPIEQALTRMSLQDYSQLAVMSGPRALRGAVTWESVGRARLVRAVAHVREALGDAQYVSADDDLLPLLPRVADAGFVLVTGPDRKLVGIVTAADVTNEFGALAEPFFLLGEIERRLRMCLRQAAFTEEELKKAASTDSREVKAVEDLTLGAVERLLEVPSHWERLKWRLDRGVFLERLRVVREIRNSLVHFSADLPSADDVAALRNFLAVLKSWTQASDE